MISNRYRPFLFIVTIATLALAGCNEDAELVESRAEAIHDEINIRQLNLVRKEIGRSYIDSLVIGEAKSQIADVEYFAPEGNWETSFDDPNFVKWSLNGTIASKDEVLNPHKIEVRLSQPIEFDPDNLLAETRRDLGVPNPAPNPDEAWEISFKNSEPAAPKSETKAKPEIDTADLVAEAKELYSQLRSIRHSPEFHELGFGEGGPNRKWFENFKSLQTKVKGNTDLIVKGVVVGDLYTIAQEWMKNRGRDTETSKTLSAQLNDVFEIKEEKPKAARTYEAREWTSADGAQTFIGKYVSRDNENVTIEKNGKPLTFSISRLSEKDQSLLQREQMLPGSTAKQEIKEETDKEEDKPVALSISGRWQWKPLNLAYTIAPTKNGFTLKMQAGGKDALEEEVTAKEDGKRIIILPKKRNPTGDYWILDEQKNLLVMDSQGLIYKATAF